MLKRRSVCEGAGCSEAWGPNAAIPEPPSPARGSRCSFGFPPYSAHHIPRARTPNAPSAHILADATARTATHLGPHTPGRTSFPRPYPHTLLPPPPRTHARSPCLQHGLEARRQREWHLADHKALEEEVDHHAHAQLRGVGGGGEAGGEGR